MAFVQTEPGCRDLLAEKGLVTPADFLNMEGVIVRGHPDRNVAGWCFPRVRNPCVAF